ncbi:MAG: hypothetical protein MUC61_01580, partial [Amoebophilaceae bacterium]|nr:hypothetical protein [Amoebophilaceae bacterium]
MVLLSLGTILLSSCSRSHQLGVNANPQDILATKLDDPHYELSPAESISLIEHCARLSGGSAAHANGKEVTLVLGNTGAGKSTFLNCLMGCEMKLVKPSELNIAGTKKVVVVAPDSARSEVMPIGHGERSQTFMPHIVSDPVSAHRVYCDCPGF